MKNFITTSVFVLFTGVVFAQSPTFQLASNSKYYNFQRTPVSDDFIASQVKVGTYLTLGNMGFGNSSWIGSNAQLDYSSYGNRGSQGNANVFKPMWNSGTALIMKLNFVDGNLGGYNHNWNHLSGGIDFLDFDQIWQIGKNTSYFLSNVGIGTDSPDSKLTVKGDIHAEEAF